MRIRATAPAKINLTLVVTGRRDDGYHTVHTVMQAIDLRETVELCSRGEAGITLSVEGADLPADERNTAYLAARVFYEKTGLPPSGVHILLRKKVPMGAGLAGGSADAAAVLAALNVLAGAHLPTERLCELGSFVGADVPFCVLGGTAVGTGTGAVLSPLPAMPDCTIVVAKPPDGVSTPEAYRLIDEKGLCGGGRENGGMEKAVREHDLGGIAGHLRNDFDAVTRLPGVEEAKAAFRSYGALGCQMTGSGSAVFGIFDDGNRAENCIRALKRRFPAVFLCHPDPRGAKTE